MSLQYNFLLLTLGHTTNPSFLDNVSIPRQCKHCLSFCPLLSSHYTFSFLMNLLLFSWAFNCHFSVNIHRSGFILHPVQFTQLLAGQLCIKCPIFQPPLISHAQNIIILFSPRVSPNISTQPSIHLLRFEPWSNI